MFNAIHSKHTGKSYLPTGSDNPIYFDQFLTQRYTQWLTYFWVIYSFPLSFYFHDQLIKHSNFGTVAGRVPLRDQGIKVFKLEHRFQHSTIFLTYVPKNL